MRLLIAFFSFVGLNFFTYSQSSFIVVDQFGYPINSPKVAILRDPQIGFDSNLSYTPGNSIELVDASNGQTVFTAAPTIWSNGDTDAPSGDRGWWFDFSSITTQGFYFVRDAQNGQQSFPFKISAIPYDSVLFAAGRMFYYNRCSTDKPSTYAGTKWTDGMNFSGPLQDANCRLITDPSNALLEKDLSGGWFDAGDYNKYVTFTHPVIHDLLEAYTTNPELFGDDWNIRKVEMGFQIYLMKSSGNSDWLLKMENSDGSTHIKMGSQNYSDNTSSPPSANSDQRFYGPTCTSASAVNASVLAHAALVFDTIPPLQSFSTILLNAAEDAFNYVIPFVNNATLEMNCDDGSIVAGDADLTEEEQLDAMVIAASYLFALTGNSTYDQFFISHGLVTNELLNDYFDPYVLQLMDAFLFYTTLPNADNAMVAEIETSIGNAVGNNWNDFYGMNYDVLYRDFMPSWSYHWGSNRPKSGYANMNLLVADYQVNLMGASQRLKALEIAHSFHGVNPLNLVYLSNMYDYGAESSLNEIYHTWFFDQTIYDHALNSASGPAPGFVGGGPNKWYSNSNHVPPFGQPDQKSYLDYNTGWPDNSWEVSEPAIYYQASYLRMLAGVMGVYNESTAELSEPVQNSVHVYPNPAKDCLHIENGSNQKFIITDVSGRILREGTLINSKIDLQELPDGFYYLHLEPSTVTFVKTSSAY